MQQKFDAPFILRLVAYTLLFTLPGLYLRSILPVFILPALSACVIMCAFFVCKGRLKPIPSVIAGTVILALLFMLIRFLFESFNWTPTDRIFLRLGSTAWILYLSCLFVFFATILFLKRPEWRKMEPAMELIVAALFFWSQGDHNLTLFSHPVKAALFAVSFVSLALVRLYIHSGTTKRARYSAFLFIPFMLMALFFIVISYNASSVSNNGGLIQPTLFRFDFSPYLSLQDEIKMNDKLVLIVRTKEENATNFLRRVYLSGWNPKRGFFEADAPGEQPQLKKVPGKQTAVKHETFRLRSPADQEYFIINFDPSSLIAMDYPVSVTPYRIWDSAAFNGAYRVTSESSGFIPFELYDSKRPTGMPGEGLSADAIEFYTNIDERNKERLGDLATSITKDIPGYYDKVLALTAYLHDGDYRYSLKPGTAPDGDQLSYFLFSAKKGYCTYFAFSLCLMLRSVGIPSRVAAGFFIQPGTGALDYYPVRANMAHAWVEVFFPKYGWMAFDPTTTQLAEGEDLQFSNNPGGDEFLQRLNEIIDKRSLMTPENSDTPEARTDGGFAMRLIQSLRKGLRRHALPLLAITVALLVSALVLRYYLIVFHSRNPRRKILFLSERLYRKITAKDTGKSPRRGGRRSFVEAYGDENLSAFYALEQKARYAPTCTPQEAEAAHALYKDILRNRPDKRHRSLSLLLILGAFCVFNPPSGYAEQSKTNAEILSSAKEAIRAENWEAAITALTEGIQAYPADPSFHYELGVLYADKSLYESAFRELSAARSLGYKDPEIYSKLSDTAGYLNRDEEALVFLKQYLESRPDDVFAWSSFGWLCYKTNRLDEGIKALHGILDAHGPDGNLYVGLGNLYTAAFKYDEAKKYYTLAIRSAEERKQPYLTSIYYYNRSILEEMFYNFDSAYADTTRSLEESARSSGYLMQGELELRRLDYKAALAHYMKALSVDSTPLAAMGLADTLLQAGYPDEAERYVTSVQEKGDLSWIANYGTTTDQFKADLYKLLRDINQYKKNREKRTVIHSLSTLVSKIWNISRFSFSNWYFDTLFRIQNDTVARYYEKSEKAYNKITGQGLYINSFYYLAFNKWQRMAKPYLVQAEAIETGHIPEAKPSYVYEHALQERNVALFDTAIRTLDPIWERQYLVKALAERLKLSHPAEKPLSREYSYRLFSLSPAALVFYDRSLPVSITLETKGKKAPSRSLKQIQSLLLHTGFISRTESVMHISITENETDIILQLIDTRRKATIYTQKMHKTPRGTQDIHSFVNSFSTAVFRTPLDI